MHLGIIGCGKVGFNTMKAFAAMGHTVRGYDISRSAQERIISCLSFEALAPDLEDLEECDIVFECVPTDPINRSGACDLSTLENIIKAFSALEERPSYRCKLFVQRSTCPPGTAQRLSGLLNKTAYAVNPSFLRKKTQWEDSISPERIAFGGDLLAIDLLRQVYHSFDTPFFVSEKFEVIELLKYIENIVDAVLISLWNEFLTISDYIDIPRHEFARLIDCLADRDKFRSVGRVPGAAFGMWCLPKDISAIIHDFSGLDINVINAALKTNDTIYNLYGVNPNAGTEMFGFPDGRLKLTNFGYNYLNIVRKEECVLDFSEDSTSVMSEKVPESIR